MSGFSPPPQPKHADVWDLTDKDKGDHVLIALTPKECLAVIAYIGHGLADSWECYDEEQVEAAVSAQRDIGNSLYDQKGLRP